MLIQGRQTVQIEGSSLSSRRLHFNVTKSSTISGANGIFWKMQNFSQKNTEKISISYMDLLTFCPAPPLPRPGDFDPCPAPPRTAPEILTLALPRPAPPRPEDFYPCPAPPRPAGKNLAPPIPGHKTLKK